MQAYADFMKYVNANYQLKSSSEIPSFEEVVMYQAVTGKNYFTGEELTWYHRMASLQGWITPYVVGAYYSTKGGYYVSDKMIDGGITSLQKLEEVGQVGESNDNLVKVYRGTDLYLEKKLYDEYGIVMSDAAREVFLETNDFNKAISESQIAHNKWLKEWKDLNTYVQAHGEFGVELAREFGIDRSMISVTKDESVAQYFAGDKGIIIEAEIPASQLIPQTLPGAGESEYLIINGFGR